MLVLGLAVNGWVEPVLTANGLDLVGLLGFAAVMGFGGAHSSLLDEQADGQVDDAAGDHQWLQPPDARLDRQRCGALRARPASRRPGRDLPRPAQCRLRPGRSKELCAGGCLDGLAGA